MNVTVGEAIISHAALAQDVSFNAWAALMWLVYDILTTLDDEVEMIWKSARSLPKYLYFFSRYFGLVLQACFAVKVFRYFCGKTLIFTTVAFFLLVLSVEISLMLRVYALYVNNKIILYILVVLFVGEIITNIVLAVIAWQAILPQLQPFPPDYPVPGCMYVSLPPVYKAVWAPVLGFETILLGLILVRCFSYRPLWKLHIMHRIALDGTIYYVIIFGAMLVSTFSTNFTNPLLANASSIWICAIYSFSGTHLLLSVRTFAAQRSESHEMSDLTSNSTDRRKNGTIPVFASAASQRETEGFAVDDDPQVSRTRFNRTLGWLEDRTT
ncbi:hypothetical protein B0H21DRAFT_756507 [Amylocystis lapponica]|nr:hypothetical protein B0H21DRAFT_756507 [Amylocystis lapponica]